MTDDKMREAFEAWMSNNGEWPQAVEYDRDGYKLMQTASAWNVWQACAASQAQEIEALRSQVQQQALDLITARSEAEEAHADAQRLQVLRDNLEHDGYGWWLPSACVREQYNPNDGDPSLDDVRATIDAMKG